MPITLDGTNGITQSASFKSNTYLDAAGGNTATINGAVPATAASPALTGIPTAPTAAVATNTTQIATTAFVSSNLGVTENENRIINGSFDFWQRGTSTTADAYIADRWSNSRLGGTVTASRQSFALGDTFGSNSPTFFWRQDVSGQSAASHYARAATPIEGVRSYAGQTITVLGWARRSSGSGNVAIGLEQTFGTGGSPSTFVAVGAQVVTLTTSWAAFAVTFTVPSISGKTLGTNNNDSLIVTAWTSAGSDYSSRFATTLGLQTIGVDLWGIHIKLGTHTAAETDLYKQPELGPELVRCQRYYERVDSFDASLFWCGNTTNAVTYYWPVMFNVTKRATPSATLFDTNTSNFATPSATSASTAGFRADCVASSTSSGSFFRAKWTADSEL